MSKHLSHQEKVKTQEKEAKEGVALGFEISAYHIQGNGVTFCPALEETHLGFNSIYKPKKVFCRKNQITEKIGSMEDSARFQKPVFQIQENLVTSSSVLRKILLGHDPIYETQKRFVPRSSSLIFNIFGFLIFRVFRVKMEIQMPMD